MSLLHNLLEKLNLKYEDLSEAERKIYQQWADSLSQPDVTIDDLKKFIPLQINILDKELNGYENSKEKDLFLKAQIRNLRMIHAFILGPEQRRKWAQEQVNKRLNN